MSVNFNATYQEINDTASKLRSGKEDVVSTLRDLKARVDQLVSEGFKTDQASGKFQTVYQEFDQGAQKVIDNLPILSQYLDQAVTAIQETDTQLANALNH